MFHSRSVKWKRAVFASYTEISSGIRRATVLGQWVASASRVGPFERLEVPSMKCVTLTTVQASAFLAIGFCLGCTPTVAPAPSATNAAKVVRAEDDAQVDDWVIDDDTPDSALDDEDEGWHVPRPTPTLSIAFDAGNGADAGDAGAKKKKSHAPDAGDAGDGGDRTELFDCTNFREETTAADALDCYQFVSDECDSYALELCQSLHFTMSYGVFAAFVECVADTPGLDFCDEDQSTVSSCATEAKSSAKPCKTHQVACAVYEACETMSVDDCNEALASYSASAIDLVSDLYSCDVAPTYFFED